MDISTARKLKEKGNKLKRRRFLIFEPYYGEAAEKYKQAGNIALSQKDYGLAIECYLLEAKCHKHEKNDFDFVESQQNIAKCYALCGDDENFIKHTSLAINVLETMEEYSSIGNCYKNIADTYLNSNLNLAYDYYTKAAHYYEIKNMPTIANTCTMEKAKILVNLSKLKEAVELYDILASDSSPDYYFKSAICYLALRDYFKATDRLYNCNDTLRGKLLEKLLEAYKANNFKLFQLELLNYTRIGHFDNEDMLILAKIKQDIILNRLNVM